jgi:hypothetical protein
MVMGFQQQVSLYPAPAVWGARASMNPTATVDAGPFNLTAGLLGVAVGKFAWQVLTASTGLAVVNNYSPSVPVIPDGFVSNEQQALITTWLGQSGMVVQPGYPVTLYNRGDFWAKTVYADAALGNKVFANLFSGDVYPAATGSFVAAEVGSAAVITATTTANSYSMNVTAFTSGILAVGQQVTGPGLTNGLYYIESAGTLSLPASSGSGTVNLTQAAVTASTGGTFSTIAQTGIGGAVASSVTAAAGNTMTVNTLTNGVLAIGQLVQPITNVAAGTYITNVTGTGPYTLTLANPAGGNSVTGTITAQACNFSAFIETPWYFNSAGNVGDLVKIGTRW